MLAALWLRSRTSSVPSIPPAVHSDSEVLRWFEEVVLPEREVWVADGPVDPVALMVLDGEWIDQLYVDPPATGNGVGGRLLGHAKARRPGGLMLWTFQSNTGARRFYERHKFTVVTATRGDNEEQAPDLCYEWRPDPVGPSP